MLPSLPDRNDHWRVSLAGPRIPYVALSLHTCRLGWHGSDLEGRIVHHFRLFGTQVYHFLYLLMVSAYVVAGPYDRYCWSDDDESLVDPSEGVVPSDGWVLGPPSTVSQLVWSPHGMS